MGSTVRAAAGLTLATLTLAMAGCGTSHHSSTATSTSTTAPTAASTSPAAAAPPSSSPPTTSGPPAGAPATTAAGTPATTIAAAAAPGCLATQLAVQVGPATGAAGSVGYTNDFKNISSTTCTLYGYPGLQMLTANSQPIPTDVIRGTSVTVPYVPEKLVTLVPGARADFDMGFAASTGYGNAKCPTSTRVEFTAPNDFQSLTVALAIQPYGGATIAQLHCGEIHVSPVYAAS
jgi:hypothetical protein